jgi:hypothetical protein
MKNVGVPDAPLRSAESTSSAMRLAPFAAAGRGEAVDVESELAGVPNQVGALETPLVGEQHIAHRPEGALPSRGLGRLRRHLRISGGRR